MKGTQGECERLVEDFRVTMELTMGAFRGLPERKGSVFFIIDVMNG